MRFITEYRSFQLPVSTTSSYLVQTIQILSISTLKSYYNAFDNYYTVYDSEFMRGMMETNIVAFFLNCMLNSAYFTFKFWISHFWNTYKII